MHVNRVREDTSLLDFSVGMLSGLIRAGLTTLNERRRVDLHRAFVEAFKVLEETLEKSTIRFWMTTHEIHGTSPDVDTILNYWLSSGFSTRDSPGTVYRFRIGRDTADEILSRLPGGAELYDKATKVLLEYLDTHYTAP